MSRPFARRSPVNPSAAALKCVFTLVRSQSERTCSSFGPKASRILFRAQYRNADRLRHLR